MNHALLGPSGASRWMSCTPSARFEEQFEDKTSEFAEEGSAAHELAELYLIRYMRVDHDELLEARIQEARQSEYYCAEMEDYVCDYVDFCIKTYVENVKVDPLTILAPEQQYDLSKYIPEGFGTGDATVIGKNTLNLIDLKYGKGVEVSAQNNPQLKLYALGAYEVYKYLADIRHIKMTIVQPRLYNIDTFEMKVEDLLKWAQEEVVPKAKQAWAGEGEFIPGLHCKFCKGKIHCKALRDMNMEIAKHEFKLPNKLTDEEIVEVLKQTDRIVSWCKAVQEYTLAEAVKGKKWPGYKLVAGRSNRQIAQPEEAINRLTNYGFKEELLYKPKEMLGITALEKYTGKKKFKELLDDIIIKADGKPKLAPESDKRPELNTAESAKKDFS